MFVAAGKVQGVNFRRATKQVPTSYAFRGSSAIASVKVTCQGRPRGVPKLSNDLRCIGAQPVLALCMPKSK